MPTADQLCRVLKKHCSDQQIEAIVKSLDQILEAEREVRQTHVVNPKFAPGANLRPGD